MNRCYKSVGGLLCVSCEGEMIRYGKSREKQRYRCKSCKRTQMGIYFNKACNFSTNEHIVNCHVGRDVQSSRSKNGRICDMRVRHNIWSHYAMLAYRIYHHTI